MRLRTGSFVIRVVLVLALAVAAVNLLALAVRFPAFAAVPLGIIAYRRLTGWHGSGDAFGTARPSGFADLLQHGLLGDDGLILGTAGFTARPGRAEALAALVHPALPSDLACRQFFAAWFGSRLAADSLIRVKDYLSLGTFAPAGAGKSVSVLVPNLWSYRRSVVVTDPKGELVTLTAEHRQRKFGHRIVRLDPFAVCGRDGDALNPLDFIDASAPDFLDQCRDLAAMLVVRTGQETDVHWNDSAERVLTSFICFVAACENDPARRNLLTVRSLLASRDSYTVAIAIMRQVPGFGGVVQRQGDALTWLSDRELNSVLAVTHRHTAWMDSPAVSACLSRSTFHPLDLRNNRLSIYQVLPPERLVTLAPLMRMWLGTLLRTLTRGPASEQNAVLFLIDEAAALGRMQILEDALTQMRGYGIRLWLFFQSIGQLQKVFGDNAQTVVDNLATTQYFATAAYDSAEHLSKKIGDGTILLNTLNVTKGHSHPTGSPGREPQPGNASTSTSVNTSESGRRYLKPEEILTLPADLALVFHKNQPVILAKLFKYFAAPEFRNGGTGQRRGLGWAAAAMATVVIGGSVMLSAAVASLPAPVIRPMPPPRQRLGQARPAVGDRPAATRGVTGRPAFRPVASRRNGSPGLPSRSGILIRIPDPPRRGPGGPAPAAAEALD